MLWNRIAAIRLCDIATFLYFAAMCLTQYGNEYIITFPLNISQLLMIAGAAILAVDHGGLKVPRLMLIMLAFFGVLTFVVNFNPSLAFTQLKTLFGIGVYFSFTYSLIDRYRADIWKFVWIYYRVAVFAAGFAIVQVVVWLVSGISLVEPVLKAQMGGFLNLRPEAFGFLPRAIGFEREPSHLVSLLLPALYFSLQRLLHHSEMKNRIPLWMAWVVVAGFTLTFSLNAFIGALVITLSVLAQKYSQHKFKLFGITMAMLLLFGAIAFSVQSLRARITQLVSFNASNLDTNNLSVFAFVSNGFVAFQAMKESHGLGFGINSHASSYDQYLGKYFSAFQVVMRLNSEDAASMYFRLLSEFGVIGLLSMIIIAIRSQRRFGGIMEQYNRVGSIVFLVVAIRNGNYMELIGWLGFCLMIISSESFSDPKTELAK